MPTDKRYSLNQLSKLSGYHYRTLKAWIDKAWLLPSGTTGVHFKYTMTDLKRAEAHSLVQANKNGFKVRMKADDFLMTL